MRRRMLLRPRLSCPVAAKRFAAGGALWWLGYDGTTSPIAGARWYGVARCLDSRPPTPAGQRSRIAGGSSLCLSPRGRIGAAEEGGAR